VEGVFKKYHYYLHNTFSGSVLSSLLIAVLFWLFSGIHEHIPNLETVNKKNKTNLKVLQRRPFFNEYWSVCESL